MERGTKRDMFRRKHCQTISMTWSYGMREGGRMNNDYFFFFLILRIMPFTDWGIW